MCETLSDKITRFSAFNTTAIEIALSMPHSGDHVHRQVLLFSIIDAMGQAVSGESKKRTEHFTNAVMRFSKWKDNERVSLLHIQRAIEKYGEKEFKSLRDFIENEIHKRYIKPNRLGNNGCSIIVDPLITDIRPNWPKDNNGKEVKLGKSPIEKFTHASLLYQYRNTVIHEFRIPGINCKNLSEFENSPHYQVVATMLDPVDSTEHFSHHWELVYPIRFIEHIARTINDEICKHFRATGKSPFARYSDGIYWLPDLNEA